MNNKNNSMLGITWILVFCLTSIIGDGIVKYMTMDNFPSSQILFIRSFLGILILLPIVIKDKTIFINKNTCKLYCLRTFFGFCSLASWFYLLKYVDFTALVAVGFTSPLFTALLAMLLLGESRSKIKITALLIGFSGAMLVVRPFEADFNIYLLFAIGSSLFWAISLIFTKKLSDKQNPITVAFYFVVFMTPLAFAIALPVWKRPTEEQWLYICLFTIIATLGQISLVKAFKNAELTTLMPFEYSSLIFAAILSYVVFGDIVTFNTLIGGAVILGSGYIVVREERKQKHKIQELEIIP